MMTACGMEHDLSALRDGPGAPDDENPDGNDGDVNPDPEGPAGGLTGRICAPSGTSYVSNATVWIVVNGDRYETSTDVDGFFTLNPVPVGTHTVQVEKGLFTTSFEVVVKKDQITELAQQECLEDDVNIAVVSGDYDHVEGFLDDLGFSYEVFSSVYSSDWRKLLADPSRLNGYDIVFINCMTTIYLTKPEWDAFGDNLRDFIASGGSVYASDYAYFFIEGAVPEAASFAGNDNSFADAWGQGSPGYVTGQVKDSELKAALGSNSVDLNYNTTWVPVISTTGTTLIEGQYDSYTGSKFGPLVFQFDLADGGRALYTSFHNEAQATQDMNNLIEEFIYSL